MAISERSRALRAEGVKVLDLATGEPDFDTPEPIRAAAKRALDHGDTRYVSPAGVPALRTAIAAKLKTENGVFAQEVLVTPGAKAALYVAIHALVEPGVEVLLPEPAWVSFRPMVALAGGTTRPIALEAGFRLTREAIERQVTAKTRVLIVNSPCNPTGRVLDEAERNAVITAAIEHDLIVITDEIYERVVYAPHRHVSLAADPRMAERTLTVNGFSKAFAMTGWRLGYLAGPARLVSAAAKIHGHLATCATSFAQAGGVAALQTDPAVIEAMVATWARRRERVCAFIDSLPLFACPKPDGAFYAFVDIRKTGLTSNEVARRLLDQHHVAVVPGAAFGVEGEGFIRVSFATSDAVLESALAAIHRFAELLEKERR